MKCVGCEESTEVTLRKPDHFTPSVGSFTCECCGSLLKYTAAKTKKKGVVDVNTQLVKVSEKLIQHIEENKKEIETNGTL